MLTVTLDRMHRRRPDARIAVLTDSPCLLRAYFPRAEGLSVFNEDLWPPPTRLEIASTDDHLPTAADPA